MQIVILLALFGLGAIFASFTGVVVERINTGQAWWRGRSRCNSCRRTLDGFDLIPIVSWIIYGGRCRTCRSVLPMSYVAYEASLAGLFALSYWKFGLVPALPMFLALLVVLGFIVLYDLRHTIVPVWSMVVLAVLAGIFGFLSASSLHEFMVSGIAAFVIGGGFFFIHAISRGRAMGLGDAPVAFALSLVTGYPQSVAGVVFSFWIGAVIGIVLLLLRRERTTMKSEIPFVPFLALGYLLALFTGWNPFFMTF